MNTTAILLLALVIVVIAVGMLVYLGRRREAALRQEFGSERRRAVGEFGDQQKGQPEPAVHDRR